MKQYLPYYRHLRAVKWPFIAGVSCGLVYALASGAGLPLMVDVVFPILFNAASKSDEWYTVWMREKLGGVSRDRLLFFSCLWIPVVFAIRGISGYLNAYLIQYSGTRVVEAIRTDLFVKLQSLPLSFFKKNRSGDLLARVMQDSEILRQVIAQGSSDLIKQPATLLFALGYLGSKAYKQHSFFVVIIALLSVPICVATDPLGGQKTRRPRQKPPGPKRRTQRHALGKPPVRARDPRLQSRTTPDRLVPPAHPRIFSTSR